MVLEGREKKNPAFQGLSLRRLLWAHPVRSLRALYTISTQAVSLWMATAIAAPSSRASPAPGRGPISSSGRTAPSCRLQPGGPRPRRHPRTSSRSANWPPTQLVSIRIPSLHSLFFFFFFAVSSARPRHPCRPGTGS